MQQYAIWYIDMCRVLYGLTGPKGESMRKAELSVYDGLPFSSGLSGRKKIALAKDKNRGPSKDEHIFVANYWRDKIRDESKQIMKGKWLPLRFIFTEKELVLGAWLLVGPMIVSLTIPHVNKLS